jgi:outer membrane immunogenic protein
LRCAVTSIPCFNWGLSGDIMWRLLLAIIALAAFPLLDSGRAADMPVKALPAPPLAPTWSWTGFYVGGNVGYSVARDSGGFDNKILAAVFTPTPERFNYSPAGTVGGGQLGLNWQVLPNWVVGIEADLQATSQNDGFTCVQQCLNVPAIAELNGTTVDQRLRWFSTLRSRVGWTNGPTLWYLTGGWAVGQLRTDINTIQQGGSQVMLTFDDTKSGWAFGGGLEFRLYGNWTARAEYLYMDLGSISHSFLYTANGAAGFPTSNIYTSDIRDHIVRAAVNYKFDWGDAGVAATPVSPASGTYYKAPAAAIAAWNWTGFYAGANVGYGVARDPTTKAGIFDATSNPILDEAFYLMPQGVIGGGQIGYNWQWSVVVLGVEADLQSSRQHDNQTCTTFCDPTPGGSIALIEQKLPWFGTLRARAGWTNGPTLLYLTGGVAYGKVATTITQSDFNGIPLLLKPFNFSEERAGWTFGGGAESQLVGNWTAKVEYLLIDLGSFTGTYANPLPPGGGFATTHSVASSTINHVVRAGLNYKFDGLPFIY